MAEAAECQSSHISRVLREQLHLTLDQAFSLTNFLRLSADDSRYFMKLVEHERAGNAAYRASIKRELDQLKTAQENLSQRLREPSLGMQQSEMLYYSSWHWSAIHIIVSIPRFQNVQAIAERLNLSPALIEASLFKLQEFGLVKFEKNRWKIAGGSMHLPRTSPINSVQHSNWRMRAVMAAQNPDEDGVHYTRVQSLSRADFERVKRLVFNTIDEYSAIANPSQEEELICFTCDFFKV